MDNSGYPNDISGYTHPNPGYAPMVGNVVHVASLAIPGCPRELGSQGCPSPRYAYVPQRSDLGTYSTESLRQLGDEERLWLYNNAFRPDPQYAFPLIKEDYGKKCSFQYAWIKQFPWLCYLVSSIGGFCRTCVLFC